MKKIKMAIRAVLSLGILSCLIFGAAGCGTEQKLPEGDKVAIGFHRKVEGELGERNIYAACIINKERIFSKNGEYFLAELFYGYEGAPQAGTEKDFTVCIESEASGFDAVEVKRLSGQEFFTEEYRCTYKDDGETEQSRRRYEYEFNHSEIIRIPRPPLRRDEFKIWVTAKSDTECYTSYPLVINYVTRADYTGFLGEAIE